MEPDGAERSAPGDRGAATQGGAGQDLPGTRNPGRAAARLGRALLLVVLAWLVSVAATWIYVQQRVEASYERSVRRVEAETRDLAALLHAQVVESLAAAEDLTRVLASGARTSPGTVRALLENLRSDRVSYRRVSLTDARGVVIASTDQARVGTSLSRRPEFLRARAERDGASLIVGKPLAAGKGRSSSIPLLRRIARPNGEFDGVVEVLIGADHLVRQFDRIDLGALGMVALVDLEGAAYARSDAARSTQRPVGPSDAAIVAAVLERARVAASGTIAQTDEAQRIAHVFSYRRIEQQGLVVVVAKSADEFLDQHALFRRDWISTGAVITALVSLVGLLSLIYLRHERRSAQALALAFAREHANARTDPLTGLPNRRAFLDLLAAQIEFHRRRGEPLSIAYFDCDRFKQVNDRLGHDAGDRCLLLVGTALSEGLRRSDYPCRIGGDEFAALFPSTRSGDAALVMERLRARLARTLAAEGFPVTVSVGVIEVVDFDSGPEALLTEVDSVMYQAKRTGGNRVVAMPSAKRGERP